MNHRFAALARIALPTLLLAGCAAPRGTPTVAPPAIVPVAVWGGEPMPPAATAQAVHRVTVHHQGEVWPEDKAVEPYLRALQRWSRQSRGWRDLPYHYIVAPDGQVYQGRPASVPGDTNTDYNPQGHVQVMLLGNFELQQPTPAQWDSAVALVGHLLRSHGLGLTALGTHRQYTAQTVCPGEHFSRRLDEFRTQVGAVLLAASR